MGNRNGAKLKNNKDPSPFRSIRPISSTVPTSRSVGGMIQNLQEDITCSICLESFNNPVSIDCGHNFCQGCLLTHWNDCLPSQYRCPECRHLCHPEQMKLDARLKSLVEKIVQLPLLEEVNKKMPTTSLVLGQPVQLLGLDENGDLYLDVEALSSCLEQEGVKDTPICLISIVGEQRRGKSFLLNFLLRRLKNLAATDNSWMGQEDEPLTGFEWHPGINTITKGIWIWNQPFLVPSNNGEVALFLIDTEGSMDIERSKENSVKLSAFSMLLSSYQVLNLSHMLKDTDLEYLECKNQIWNPVPQVCIVCVIKMFLCVAETVGHQYKLKPIQHLDLLVRDWFFPPTYGFQGGQNYLHDIIQKLDGQPSRHPRALQTLKSTNSNCYLMPFPGKKLVMGTEGTIADMDEDFRECLKDYVNYIANSAGMHMKVNQDRTPLTGTQLAVKIKDLSDLMKQYQSGFSSPTQMIITFNQNTEEKFRKKFKEFIEEQDQLSRPVLAGLRVTPAKMTKCFQKKQQELLQECNGLLQGDKACRNNLVSCLEKHFQRETKAFLERYTCCYKSRALKAGIAIGVGAVGLAGGAIGAGVAAALVAAEAIVLSTGTAATFLIGTTAGASTFALVGGGVGAGVGRRIGNARIEEAKNVAEDDNEIEEEEEENVSDERSLIS